MATVILTIPDDQIDRVVDALCAINGWTDTLGVTRAAFAKACLIRDLTATVQNWERREAEEAALEAVNVGPVVIS